LRIIGAGHRPTGRADDEHVLGTGHQYAAQAWLLGYKAGGFAQLDDRSQPT
jgi:hypothetical protein